MNTSTTDHKKQTWQLPRPRRKARAGKVRSVSPPPSCLLFSACTETLITPRPQSEILVCPVGCGIKQNLRAPPAVPFLGATVASSSFTAQTRSSPCFSPSELCLFYAWALPENAANLFCLSSLATPDHFSKRLHASPSKFNMRERGLQTQAEPLKVP